MLKGQAKKDYQRDYMRLYMRARRAVKTSLNPSFGTVKTQVVKTPQIDGDGRVIPEYD